ncbi:MULTISPECIES: hypothetical protein [unclassified Ensifer]|uniref:hypothetical protein n=1 Tax=unclassified Ensifer TaxID=2633371 RepID=UPI000812C133|nr:MULTISPECIES: hypothetical protein [unclassified Ensifer]OCP10162.1 hypothetical protein BC362_08280 [Ensifer sp. LC14]OCP12175.1 hypothetical protein BC374_15165 [Ensifer sp. LC13]OCP12993.1 hypothetical protein BBX50_14940 [Ensifer sp. LC11]OCP33737.1 hypothetical protein BC364_14255 [Ensifer sp. LC499]
MYFHIDQDTGAYISGWVICDNPGDTPEILVRASGRKELALTANVFRPDLRDLGMHSTGQAGFVVDERHVPDLHQLNDITLIESETGITIYKRFNASDHIERKLLLVDSSAFPQIALVRQLMSFFTQSYPVLERLSLETITGLLSLTNIKSAFLTGSMNWIRHGEIARDNGFVTAALLREPFAELAEKLIFLTHATRQSENVRASPTIARFADLLPYLEDLDFRNSRSILSALRRIPNEGRKKLQSPMTMLFGTAPDERVQRRNVSVALDNLAKFNVVGLRNHFDLFCGMLNEYVEAPIASGLELSGFAEVEELAERLRNIGIASDLLDEDIALYSYAVEAIEESLQKTDDPGQVSSDTSK